MNRSHQDGVAELQHAHPSDIQPEWITIVAQLGKQSAGEERRKVAKQRPGTGKNIEGTFVGILGCRLVVIVWTRSSKTQTEQPVQKSDDSIRAVAVDASAAADEFHAQKLYTLANASISPFTELPNIPFGSSPFRSTSPAVSRQEANHHAYVLWDFLFGQEASR
ncbi:hypothetical protein HDU83_000799 [Entophlyctis luteolus]|nr:hypothetical protein HDU83_000799 [Entophlyctis luteolus]